MLNTNVPIILKSCIPYPYHFGQINTPSIKNLFISINILSLFLKWKKETEPYQQAACSLYVTFKELRIIPRSTRFLIYLLVLFCVHVIVPFVICNMFFCFVLFCFVFFFAVVQINNGLSNKTKATSTKNAFRPCFDYVVKIYKRQCKFQEYVSIKSVGPYGVIHAFFCKLKQEL